MTYYPLIAFVVALVSAQVMKPFIIFFKDKEFDLTYLFASGGYPSSHSSSVVALTLAIGLKEGFDSSYFAICFGFMSIVLFDSFNVRYYSGKNIEVTKQLVHDLKDIITNENPIYAEKLKEKLGHTLSETITGILLGILVALMLYFMWR